MRNFHVRALLALSACSVLGTAALAQDNEGRRRVRVGLGAQVVPSFPGADNVRVLPYGTLSLGREGKPFDFATADQSFGLTVIESGPLQIGPAATLRGARTDKDVGVPLGKVGTTIEAGGFVQYAVWPSFRLRAEARKGLGGHEGFVGDLSADYILRNGDAYVFSVGPRLRLANGKFQRAYYGVNPAQSAPTGLPVFSPKGGVQSVGAAAGLTFQITPAWGISSYARYDRLVDDAARSPIVRRFGSRNQYSGGLALTYTFTMGR